MLTIYKNEIFEVIKSCGLQPEDFKLSSHSTEDAEETTVSIIGTKLEFIFNQSKTNFHHFKYCFTRYDPVFSKPPIMPNNKTILQFDKVKKVFKNWLTISLKDYWHETEAINKWDQLAKASQELNQFFSISDPIEDNDQVFTPSEISQIAISAAQAKQYFLERGSSVGLMAEQIALINSKIDYLTKVAEDAKISKINWKMIFVGLLFTTIARLGLTEEQVQFIFQELSKAFSNLFLH